jgi:regulator of protease activity HflC (stomatin/prohibitin superfamily)
VLELVVALLIVVVAAALLFRFVIEVVTIRDFQRGVRFRNGRLAGLLSTGTHVAVRPVSEIQVIDGRPTSVTVPRQEILTADGIPVKVTLAARYVVVDPVTAVTGDQSWLSALYATLQASLRAAVAGRTVDELLAARDDLGPAVAGLVASDLARIGVELLGVDVRDVMVPAELKRASVSIVAARLDAVAAVERARGESAALRSLANAGPVSEAEPGIVGVRPAQGAGGRSGRSMTLGLRGGDAEQPTARAIARRPSGIGSASGEANGSATADANVSASGDANGSESAPEASATRVVRSRPGGRPGPEA